MEIERHPRTPVITGQTIDKIRVKIRNMLLLRYPEELKNAPVWFTDRIKLKTGS